MATLNIDIVSMFKQKLLGRRGEKVTIIATHGDTLIVEGKNGRFAVLKSEITE